MARPTINDLAAAAGVSVSTVNRILADAGNVRPETIARVRDAADAIGFYGRVAINSRIPANRPKLRLGFLLLQQHRAFYRMLGDALRAAAAGMAGYDIETRIEFVDDLSPQHTADRMLRLGETSDAIAVVAAVHPLVTTAIEALQGRGVPVFALISQLAATGQAPYVGHDNWQVGRMSAWFIERMCKSPGKVGILVGNHRYRCQEMNESGFRSYFREHAPEFTLLEPRTTFESSAVAQEITEKLLVEHPDLAGLYVAGGGVTGACAAIRDAGRSGRIVAIGYQLMEATRAALLDGTLSVVISLPLPRLAEAAVSGMVLAASNPDDNRNYTTVLPFDIHTRENI